LSRPDDLKPIFKALELTPYESRVWQALLEKGGADARELVRTTRVPFGRIYEVLNSLIGRDLVEVQESRPRLYRPRRIAQVVEELLQKRKADLDADYNKLEDAGEEAKKLFALQSERLPRDEVFVSVALNDQGVRSILRDLHSSAKKEILKVVRHKQNALQFARLVEEDADRLQEAAVRGTSVRIIFSEQVPQSPQSVRVLEAKTGKPWQRLQLRIHPQVLNQFEVIDRRYVVLEAASHSDPDSPEVLVKILSARFANHMAADFESLWGESSPLGRQERTVLHPEEALV
jgi:sugar-specific transcriptional regulator TrmB